MKRLLKRLSALVAVGALAGTALVATIVVSGKATAPALAETGVDGGVMQVVGGIALILLLVGTGIFFYRRKGAEE